MLTALRRAAARLALPPSARAASAWPPSAPPLALACAPRAWASGGASGAAPSDALAAGGPAAALAAAALAARWLTPLARGLSDVAAAVVDPAIVLTGKGKQHGKNKRRIKKANHGARPCNSTGRRWRRNRRTRPPHGS